MPTRAGVPTENLEKVEQQSGPPIEDFAWRRAFLAPCTLIARLCAPVPLMRHRSAPARSPVGRPGRSAAKAFDTRSAEPSDPTGDFLLRERLCLTMSVRLVAGSVNNDREGCNRARACCCLLLQRRVSVPSSWAGFRPPGGGEPLYPNWIAKTHPRPWTMATRHHLLTDGLAAGSDQLRGQLARPKITRSVRSVPPPDVAGCLQDDAPVRRASRLRTTSDGVRWAH
jgi:hypothetical protein